MDIDQFKRLEELFDAALSLPPDQRYAFLEDACGPDKELPEKVVRLLRHANATDTADDDRS